MRVSDSQLYGLNKDNVATARARLAKLQRQAMDGQKVSKPSDDPVAAAHARRQTARGKQAETHQRTVNAGSAALQIADAALDQVGAALSRVRELAVQAASDTVAGDDRSIMAQEVRQLREAIREAANTDAGGKHVFAGYNDDSPPFDATGVYNGGTTAKELEVAPGVRVQAGITGDRVFGPAGGTDIFADIDKLVTALESNDVTSVRGALTDLDTAQIQVSDARGDLGSFLNHFDVANAVAERVELHAAETRANLVEVDPIEAFMDLNQAQSALQSAIQIASQLPLPGLASR